MRDQPSHSTGKKREWLPVEHFGCDEIMSSSLQMLQECQHLCGIEITQIQLAHGSLPSRGDKTEKEHEGISIAEDGVRAAPAHAG